MQRNPLPLARAIAFYLPQFHAIPENDAWWGSGFTEWTNVKKAGRLFVGHRQPRRPGELGYYDLLSPQTRASQAGLAQEHGIAAFCYWHYWFAGKLLLERPFQAVLKSGEPRLPFCLGWANHSWTAAWVGRPWQTLVDQSYPGRADYEAHFAMVREAFADERYLTVHGKPLFVIFRPGHIPQVRRFTDLWRELAVQSGFRGLYLLGMCDPKRDPGPMGLDGTIAPGIGHIMSFQSEDDHQRFKRQRRLAAALQKGRWVHLRQAVASAGIPSREYGAVRYLHDRVSQQLSLPVRRQYPDLVAAACLQTDLPDDRFPCISVDWDDTPRFGRWGKVLEKSSPSVYAKHLKHALERVENRPWEERLVFLKSWNEWAEGNYLEPDDHWGRAYLEATRDVLMVRS